MSGVGATSVAPADGALLWEHAWPRNSRIVPPALTANGDVLIGAGALVGVGMRRIAIAHGPGGWTTEERWTSSGLKPYFNDFVVHDGRAFGFDGSILACIDIEDGKRKWKGGRYGHGQLVLLRDQDVLLVLSEQGELALVAASPLLLLTAIGLFLVPWHWHHRFGKSAIPLAIKYMKLLALGSFALGVFILVGVL